MAYYDICKVHVGIIRHLGFEKVYVSDSVKNRLIFSQDAKSLGNMAKKSLVFFLKSYELDLGTIKAVAQNNGAFAIAQSDFVFGNGNSDVSLAKKIGMARLFVKACRKEGARIILCSMASEEFMVPSARELVFFGLLLGIEESVSKQALSIANIYLEDKQQSQKQ